MAADGRNRSRGLLQSSGYVEEYDRQSSKYRSQIARKAHDLARNPEPGGSRTTLAGFDGLCRVRAGDFRIIYAYNEDTVELLTLRRRNERTYDDLDELETRQLQKFCPIEGTLTKEHDVPAWEELAKKWAEPKPKLVERLPRPITPTMLDDLAIPDECRAALLRLTTVDDLQDCDEVADEIRYKVLDFILPRRKDTAAQEPKPIVVIDDLVDAAGAVACGPIDAAEVVEGQTPESVVRPAKKGGDSGSRSGPPARRHVPAPLVVTTTRRQEPMKPYPGNTQKGIAKDTSYSVKLNGSVQLLYYVGASELALLTTDEHPELVALVNEAKRIGLASQGGGRFIINEYRHVLVPTPAGVLFAGAYTRDLEFVFEGTLVSPVAPPGIRPGDVWPGPHVGVRYTLAVGATDVRFEAETTRGTFKRVSLTDHHSATEVSGLLQMARAVKANGGAVYVNEAREMFAPVDDGKGYQRRYIGHIGRKPWFPVPV
jgi:mRNA-degrading endonuclease RelE of RelBE toxin-antitoxin system